MRDFRKIIAWQKAHALAVRIGDAIDVRRFNVRPGLRSQLLRAIDAVPALISEGAGKRTNAEFARFLEMALSSAREVDNHLLLAKEARCLDGEAYDQLATGLDEVKRVLYSFWRAVRRDLNQ